MYAREYQIPHLYYCFHIQVICADDSAMSRVLQSYKMMLDFYGMKLTESGNYYRTQHHNIAVVLEGMQPRRRKVMK